MFRLVRGGDVGSRSQRGSSQQSSAKRVPWMSKDPSMVGQYPRILLPPSARKVPVLRMDHPALVPSVGNLRRSGGWRTRFFSHLFWITQRRLFTPRLTETCSTAKTLTMSKEFSAVKTGVSMFAMAPLIGALCPLINAATAGGSLQGILPEGAGQRLSEGLAGVASGAQSRVNSMISGLRGRGLGVDLGETPGGGDLFSRGLAMPSQLGLGSLESGLSKVAGFARQGMAG